MLTKSEVRKAIKSALYEHGFRADGNYYRRVVGETHQALYLQPAYYGGVYFPEMLISYRDLNSDRKNTQMDCHLRSRLSCYFHPEGNPRETPLQDWFIVYGEQGSGLESLQEQIGKAVPIFLDWLSWYPTWTVAENKMKRRDHATWVSREHLFQDLGQDVPLPA